MKRIVRPLSIAILTIVALWSVSIAQTQARASMHRIGVLSSGSGKALGKRVRKALHELGYVDRHNIVIVKRPSGLHNVGRSTISNE